jgi:23S rRNA pseudouridine1911/1915/1917 synthase
VTELRLVVPEGRGGRADRFAADLSGLSRSRVQRLIAEGRVTADGNPVRANSIVGPGAILVIDVPPPAPAAIEPEAIPLIVVYEDADVLVVDKPAGLVVHPSPGHWSGTLVNALLARDTVYGGIAGVERPGIVHRLDRDTSGLLMVARTDAAQVGLQAQLKARRIHKRYLALVAGSVTAQLGRIEAPVGRDPKHRQRMAVVPDGRPSVTGYRVRERFRDWTLLECDLVTGRTHQIRVHLASIGHPVAGDALYGGTRTPSSRRSEARAVLASLERPALHAARLAFTHPATGERREFAAPLPPDLVDVVDRLRAASRSAPGC